jgi:type VI secretion system protein ImpE
MNKADIREVLQAKDLEAAIRLVTERVKANPADQTARITLFELLCFAGEFDRANKQIDVVEQQRNRNDLSVQIYRNCLKADRERHRVYEGSAEPYFFSHPPDYVDLQMEAIKAVRKNEVGKAKDILNQAEESRPAISGRRNGKPFKDFRDWDDFAAPVLEVFIHDKYTWLPFEQIKTLEIRPPEQLRDMIWTSAKIESIKGTRGEVIVPALYAGTAQDTRTEVRMGRRTEWHLIGEDVCRAVGLRIFLADDEEVPVFELNKIEFDSPEKKADSVP